MQFKASQDWQIAPGTVYLNHGSFGPPPFPVRRKQLEFQSRCNAQPMDFFVRQLEPAWYASRDRLAKFVGCEPGSMVFCENATSAMNLVASFFPLEPGDEVLLNNHEYGVVQRIWERKCKESSAVYKKASIPAQVESSSQIVDALAAACTSKTKLIVVSHITSPTAITFPLAAIIEMAKSKGIPVCVDGPHAPMQVTLNLMEMGCDFYLASCHKWLSAPFGTGFVYVAPKWQECAAWPRWMSWGRLPPTSLEHWTDHYVWSGTRDYSGYLSVGAAIEYIEGIGIEETRDRNHRLACWARQQLTQLLHQDALVPDGDVWYQMMTSVFLPAGDHSTLQKRLWQNHGIEVPIVLFEDRYHIRVSCHLYNDENHIERLMSGLKQEISW